MTVLKFQGRVNKASECPRVYAELTIDCRDVIREISYAFDVNTPVTVTWSDHKLSGDVVALIGVPSGGEWTPEIPAELEVGDHNLLEMLRRYEGQTITLWVADEPVNVLEDDETT